MLGREATYAESGVFRRVVWSSFGRPGTLERPISYVLLHWTLSQALVAATLTDSDSPIYDLALGMER